MNHLNAFRKNAELISKYGEGNAHQVWCMAAYLDEPDFEKLASDGLTDGKGDRKIDFLLVQNSTLYISQGYFAGQDFKIAAPANKAADLNTGLAWLTSGSLSGVPEKLRVKIKEARELIDAKVIDTIEILYTHNCSESKNVEKELATCADYLNKAYQDKEIMVSYKELGCGYMEKLYTTYSQQIVVKEDILFDGELLSSQEGDGWTAHIGFVSGKWLHDLYKMYSSQLFSANYRGFMGISGKKKINNAIRTTAEKSPNDFFVYNNGISILTTSISEDKKTLGGISIINGAQTTGSIASSTDAGTLDDVNVLCKVIVCTDTEKVKKIVEYNNTQNYITTWDHYSNSSEQKLLEQEFKTLGHIYTLKRGFDSAGAEIGIEMVAQPLVAIRGDFANANRGKNYVFETKNIYDSAFHETKAQHVLLALVVSKAIESVKKELNEKNDLSEVEEKRISFLQSLRSKNFLVAVIGGLLPLIFKKNIDPKTAQFTYNKSLAKNNSLDSLIVEWMPLVKYVLSFVVKEVGDNFAEVLAMPDGLKKTIGNVGTLLTALQEFQPVPQLVALGKDVE